MLICTMVQGSELFVSQLLVFPSAIYEVLTARQAQIFQKRASSLYSRVNRHTKTPINTAIVRRWFNLFVIPRVIKW